MSFYCLYVYITSLCLLSNITVLKKVFQPPAEINKIRGLCKKPPRYLDSVKVIQSSACDLKSIWLHFVSVKLLRHVEAVGV